MALSNMHLLHSNPGWLRLTDVPAASQDEAMKPDTTMRDNGLRIVESDCAFYFQPFHAYLALRQRSILSTVPCRLDWANMRLQHSMRGC